MQMNWLDTETKAILQKKPDTKLAPPKSGEFALVLLKKGADHDWLVRTIRRVNSCLEVEADYLARLPLPATINRGVTEGEALFRQFELICCDTIVAFIRSEVVTSQSPNYLHALYHKILASPEFKEVKMDVLEIPQTEAGENFVSQFLGISPAAHEGDAFHWSALVTYKKARIMKHWAARIGAQVRCDAIQDAEVGSDIFDRGD
jgi:hypothetical protein